MTDDERIFKQLRIDIENRLRGCGVCGGSMTKVRGRYPGDPMRDVCPTCLAERMDHIHAISSRGYGVASQEKP